MSRSRSGSRASGPASQHSSAASSAPSSATASADPFAIKFNHLSQPTLLSTYDHDRPRLPPLPQPELALSKASQPVYVGEEFQCLVAVQLLGDGAAAAQLDAARLRIEAQAPDGPRSVVFDELVAFTPDKPYAVQLITLDIRVPGPWVLLASVRYERGASELLQRRSFKIEAAPAISVRTKVSRGSSALDAHVVEAQVENLSDSTLLVESLALNPSNGWEAIAPSSAAAEQETTGGSIILRPHDVQQWSFVLRGGRAPEAGPLAIGWRREPLGTRGWQTTGSIRV